MLQQFFRNPADRWLVVTVLTTAALLLVTLIYPFAMDHNIYQTMGLQLVRYHQLPTLGSWDTNFPGIAFIHAIAMLLFGNSVTAFRAFDALMHVALAAVLYRLLLRWVTPRSSFFIVLISVAIFLFRNEWNSGEREGYAAFCSLTAVLILYDLKDNITRAKPIRGIVLVRSVVLGILAALTIIIRPTFGLIAISLMLGIWMLPSSNRRTIFLGFTLGGMSTVAIILAAYAAVPGGLSELYTSVIRFNVDIYAAGSYRVSYISVLLTKPELIANVVLLAALALLFKRKREGAPMPSLFDLMMLAAYYLSARLSIIIMGKYWRYHYELVLIITAVLLGLIVENIFSRSQRPLIRSYGVAAVALLLLAIGYPWRTAGFYVSGLLRSNDVMAAARKSFAEYYGKEGEHQKALVQYVKRTTSTNDRVEVFSQDPNLAWNAPRRPASRFTSILSIAMQLPHGGYTEYQLRWRKEFIDSLISADPRLIIVSDSPSIMSNFLVKPPNILAHSIPGFDSVLATRYDFDTMIYYFEVYRRKRH